MENQTIIFPIKLRGQNAVYCSGDIHNNLILTGKCYMRGNLRYVESICVCGKVWFALYKDVLSARTKSCGCKRIEYINNGNITHGMNIGGGKHPIYRAWYQMKNRCKGTTPQNKKNYLDKGIVVCPEWANSFSVFHEWALGNGWKPGLTLDRRNNNEGYNPSNCRWITNYEQQRNKSTNIFVTAFGETKCITDWERDERCHVKGRTIKYRIEKLNYSPELAVSVRKVA